MPVPLHKGKDDDLGFFAKEILKEDNIDPKYTGGYPIEVSPKVAFAIELRKARAGHSQKEVAAKAGMTYQQYQRLENPHKTNPTLETLYKLQKVFNRPFLAL